MEDTVTYLCPRCQTPLALHRDGESLWCDNDCEKFNRESLEQLRLWRSMSLEGRAAEVARLGNDVVSFYGVSDFDVSEVESFIQRRKGEIILSADVAPDKEALLSLARGLSTAGALREMIDNSLDCAQRKREGAPIVVSIDLNAEKGFVRVADDAGGMNRAELVRCLTLGAQSPEGHVGNVIGKFGVGAKEAIYHFGREVTISTCDLHDVEPLEVFVPARWLDNPSWEVNVQHGNAIPGTTQIQIGVLGTFDFDSATIRSELSDTYARRMAAGRLTIIFDGYKLEAPPEPIKLYPPEFYPRQYTMMVSSVMVDVEVSMLDNAPEASGIFFYTFGRRFAHWAWSDPLTRTIFDKPPQHRLNSHFRVDVDFQGNIDDVPINSNKDQVDTTKYAFKPLAKIISKIAAPYLSIISWLSKENNMGYLKGSYAGAEKPHRSIDPTSAGFSKKIELGKIFETMPLPKSRVADPTILYTTIAGEREPKSTPEPPPYEGDHDKPSGPNGSQPPKGSGGDKTDHRRPKVAKATILVSLLTDDLQKIEQFKKEIAKAADGLGVGHTLL